MAKLPEARRFNSARSRRVEAPIALAVLLLLAVRPASGTGGKDLFGWLETVQVGRSRLEMSAKLDTGADTSSLDATRIRRYRRSGQPWVEFRVEGGRGGRRLIFRRPVVRMVRIKEHDGEHQRRPVVEVEVCLGDHWKRVQVSLIDRSEFRFPLLLGRRALEDMAVVDPDLTFTRKPHCGGKGSEP